MADRYYGLDIGTAFGASWKHWFPPIVSVLFLDSEPKVESDGNEDEEEPPTVSAQMTVCDALAHLDQLGLSERFFESVWSRYRELYREMSLAFMNGWKQGADLAREWRKENGEDETKGEPPFEDLIRRLRDQDARQEIEAATRLLRDHGPIEWNSQYTNPDAYLLPTVQGTPVKELETAGVVEATALGEFLDSAREHFVEVGWLFETYLMLRASDRDETVKLTFANEYVTTADEAVGQIRSGTGSIADKIDLYETTFAALLDGDGRLQRRVRRDALRRAWSEVTGPSRTVQEKGRRLEEFTELLAGAVNGFEVIERNLKTEVQELDVVIKNNVDRPFWTSLSSPLIYVECKNWSNSVDVTEARVLESKMSARAKFAGISLFVAVNGVTKAFQEHVSDIKRAGLNICIVEAKDIDSLLADEDPDALGWLEKLIASQLPR